MSSPTGPDPGYVMMQIGQLCATGATDQQKARFLDSLCNYNVPIQGDDMDWSGRGPNPMTWNPNPIQLPSPVPVPPPLANFKVSPNPNYAPLYPVGTGYTPDPRNPDGIWWRSGRHAPKIQFSEDMPVLPYSAEECYPPLSPDPIWEREREAERADRLREREVRRLERLRRVAGYQDW